MRMLLKFMLLLASGSLVIGLVNQTMLGHGTHRRTFCASGAAHHALTIGPPQFDRSGALVGSSTEPVASAPDASKEADMRSRFKPASLVLAVLAALLIAAPVAAADPWQTFKRSEERRVGKECRSRWSP